METSAVASLTAVRENADRKTSENQSKDGSPFETFVNDATEKTNTAETARLAKEAGLTVADTPLVLSTLVFELSPEEMKAHQEKSMPPEFRKYGFKAWVAYIGEMGTIHEKAAADIPHPSEGVRGSAIKAFRDKTLGKEQAFETYQRQRHAVIQRSGISPLRGMTLSNNWATSDEPVRDAGGAPYGNSDEIKSYLRAHLPPTQKPPRLGSEHTFVEYANAYFSDNPKMAPSWWSPS